MAAMWGSLAGGAADGFSGGIDIAAKIKAQQEALRAERVKAAAASGMVGPQTPPAPGQPSLPGGPPQQVAMPGAQPMAGPPGGGMGPPPGAPGPSMGANMPRLDAQINRPQGAPPPVGSTGAPVSATAAPQPPAPGGMDPARQEAQQTLTSITQSIKAANPGISMLDLFDATELSIGQMKGVNDALKNQMAYDTNTAKLMFGLQVALEKIQSNDRNVDVKALANQTVQELKNQGLIAATEKRTDAQRDVARIGADSRVTAAGIGADSRVTAAGIGADSRRDVAGTQADARVTSSANQADASIYGADRRADSSDFRTRSGGMPTKDGAPKGPARPTVRSSRGGGGASAAPPFPPTAGHKATGPDGTKWTADGKTWKKVG
jgi:hypothetical protein